MSEQAGRELQGKLAIVTGASRGIGAAVSEVLAKKGANLVLNYTSPSSEKRTNELADRLSKQYNINALAAPADLGSVDGPEKLVATAQKGFSKDDRFQIDIIINNAGVNSNNPISSCTAQDFDFQYHVNVRGPLLLLKAALPFLPHDRSGRIVNVSSVSSQLGYETQSVYGGTKAALEAMTRTWARELAERATVNAINPGPVATGMYDAVPDVFVEQNRGFLLKTPLAKVREGVDREEFVAKVGSTGGRPAYEEEVAGLVGLLCLREAGWTTGSVVCANGGMRFVS